MRVMRIVCMVVLTIIPRAISNKVLVADSKSKELAQPTEISLDRPDPALLSFLNNLSDRDNLAELEANIRRQRQIRFKSSYQELPKSLKTPLWGGEAIGEIPSGLSYFIQVDVDDPPPSSALTTLPEGTKTYFPPQVSEPIFTLVKDTGHQQKPNLAFIDDKGQQQLKIGGTLPLQSLTQEKDASLYPPLNSLNSETNSFHTPGDQNAIPTSINLPLTTSNSLDVINFHTTTPRQEEITSGPSFFINNSNQNTNTQEVTHSSYLSYTPKGSPKSIVSTQSDKSASNPSLSATTEESSYLSHEASFSGPPSPLASPLPVTTTSSPPNPSVLSQSNFDASVTTTKFPKKVSGSATSPLPSFVPATSPQNQPFINQQQPKSFSTSLLGMSLTSKHKANQVFPQTKATPKPQSSEVTPLSSKQFLLNRPKPKSQISQSRPSLKPQLSQSPSISRFPKFQPKPSSKSQNQFSLLSGNLPSSTQRLAPPTRPYSPPPKSSSKSLMTSSSKVFQANMESRRIASGVVLESSSKDGKTLVNSDDTNISAIPGRSGSDYPTLQTIPETGFNCASKDFGGYYADQETNCQVFHVCWGRRSASFLCPGGTLFNQRLLVCDWWYNVDCASTDAFTERGTPFDYWGRNQI